MNDLASVDVLDGLTDFVAIVDAGSVSGAARVLGVPRATLSRRLSRLEDRLGVRLVHRTTRKLAPSPAGHELYRRARHILEHVRAAEEAVRRLDGVPRGLLRVSAVPAGADPRFADLFLTFLDRWPEVQLDLATTPRHVDLVAEGYDCALRGGLIRDQGLVARSIRSSRVSAWASTDYIARHGLPTTGEELIRHECVRSFDPISDRPVSVWPKLDGSTVAVRGRLATSEMGIVVRAMLRGTGIGMVPEEVVDGLAVEQRALLRPVLHDELGMSGRLSVVYPEREHLDPKVRAFVDHAVAFLSADTPLPDALPMP